VRVLEAVTTDEGVLMRLRTNEGVRMQLLLDGKKVAHANKRTAGFGRLTWQPPGIPPASGLTLAARDRSGNRSEPVPVSVATP
jgi:hypothetical protein